MRGNDLSSAADAAPVSPLERRYRRWMEVFPADYRARREDELVGVLLDRAAPDQRRPSPGDVTDLVRAGVIARTSAFRGSPRQRAWGDAGSIVGMLIALALCAQGLVYVMFWVEVVGDPRWPTSFASGAFVGWQVPAVWALAVALVLIGWTRPAMIAAWAAVAARILVTVDLVGAGQGYLARQTMPQLAAAVVAAVLLSRPRRVREVIDRCGRLRLTLTAVVILGVHGLRNLRHGDVSVYLGAAALTVTAVVAWAVTRAQAGRPLHDDPVARRVLIGVVAVVPIYLASGTRTTNPWFTVDAGSLAKDAVICLLLAAVWLLVVASLASLARRLPFRVVRIERGER